MEKDITEAQEQMNLSQWESLPDEEILTPPAPLNLRPETARLFSIVRLALRG